jgi:hypothetical protein
VIVHVLPDFTLDTIATEEFKPAAMGVATMMSLPLWSIV